MEIQNDCTWIGATEVPIHQHALEHALDSNNSKRFPKLASSTSIQPPTKLTVTLMDLIHYYLASYSNHYHFQP